MTDLHPETFLPPQHIEAEAALLGSLMLDPDAFLHLPSRLRGESFYVQRHGRIFDAALALHRQHQPVDFLTLAAALEQNGQLADVGGAGFLASLINAVPSAVHAPAYARLILEAAQARRLIQLLSQAVARLYDGGKPVAELTADLERDLLALQWQAEGGGPRHIADIGQEVMAGLEAAMKGESPPLFSTGYADLDKILGGFQPSNLILLGARPAVGKTALLLNFATHAARQGRTALIFSLEMPAQALHRRLLTAHTGVNLVDLNACRVTETVWPSISRAAAGIGQTSIWVDDTPAISLAEVRNRALQVAVAHGLDLVLLDYVQLVTGGQYGQKRYQEVGEVARALKALAKELRVPVLAASQLTREVERRPDHRPTLADLRESGDLEQHADIVLFIQRDREATGWSEADIIIAKHRNGPLGTVRLLWQPDWVRFVAVAPGVRSN